MRIAWFTPWTSESAIAGVSALVVTALRDLTPDVEVDIWHPAGAGGRTDPVAAHQIDVRTSEALRDYDAVIYNIGNHLGFHGAIYETSLKHPGTVILHDVVLADMFLPLLLALSGEELRRTLAGWYGPAGRQVADALREDPEAWLWTEGNTARFPMLEPVLAGATQVITHSRYAADLVRERYLGDVHTFGLPPLHWPAPASPAVTFDWLDERPMVLQGGSVNPNKCVSLVLRAFHEHNLDEHLQLVIAGHITAREQAQLDREIARAGMTGSVHALGAVDHRTMQSLLQRASIATVLRSPVTESSSGVLVDSLAHGLATVSVDLGHYREYPADVLRLLPAPPTATALGELLAGWARQTEEVTRRGRAAAAYAARRLSAQVYAESLLEILPFRAGARRRTALAAAAGALVARNGFTPSSELARRVADQAVLLFANEPRRGRP